MADRQTEPSDTPSAMRLDAWLVQAGRVPSRARAVALIESGGVSINGKIASKSSQTVANTDVVSLLQNDHGYVSRGALKLKALVEASNQHALFADAVVLDVGASTGGFTEVSLEYGARTVVAVDVGQDQLHARLRNDPRVQVKEQTDARALAGDKMFDVINPTILVADISFISLEKILPLVIGAVAGINDMFILVKPQFEVGREHVGKGGIVKNAQARQQAIEKNVILIESLGFEVHWQMDCPISGGDGNQEFLVYAKRK